MGSLFLWSQVEDTCLLSSCTLSSSIWLTLSSWQMSCSAPSLFWPFLSCMFFGCCLLTAAPVWPGLAKNEVGKLQLPLWPASTSKFMSGFLFKSMLAHFSPCIYLVFSLPARFFLHSSYISRPFPRALSCLALGKVPFPFNAMLFKGLMLWSFLESCWILLSRAPSPTAAGSGPTWNNQAESP